MTNETKIKRTPFFAFKFRDYINLDGNYNYTIHFVPYNSSAETVLVKNITSLDVTVARKQFVPEQRYIVSVSFKTLIIVIYESVFHIIVYTGSS